VPLTILRKASLALRALLISLLSNGRLASIRGWFPLSVKRRIREALERPTTDGFRFHRTLDWQSSAAAALDKWVTPDFPKPVSLRVEGVNLYGYFSRWLGLGECARLHAHAMLATGYPVALHDVDIDIPHDRKDRTLAPHFGSASSFTRDLIFVNPDHWEDTLLSIGSLAGAGRYVIGYWFWELENFPRDWLFAIDKVDEIMVSSTFVEQCLRRVCDKPITHVPMPVAIGRDSGLQRSHFGLCADDYVFFCSFDFNSSVTRKNPYAVIEAFRLAFPRGDEKVTLLIKSSNGDRHTASLRSLLALAAADPRITIKDDLLERHDLRALHRCIDVYVSMHRSEGFGLGIAEAMCMGKPVVATAYSGNMDFMTTSNSCLVDYQMIDLQPGDYPHAEGQRWADPDPHHAARHFERLYLDRALGARLGDQAARDLARDFSVEACMKVMMQRLRRVDIERNVLA